ncbi:M28 family metallopeptidase [Salinirubellus sp. GCM10025818]|uniref:M28 family metallopeptidase n=1 Tax=Salinirubellus TaxID=2162630 RepID=UPI0030D2D7BD
MSHLSNTVVGDGYRSTFAWDLLEELTEIGSRMAGQEGEAEGARVFVEGLERAGLREAGITEFEIPGWWRGSSSLAVEAGNGRGRTFEADYEVLGLPGSPGETVEAEMIDVGAGLPTDFEAADLEGRIAMVGSQNPPDFGRAINRIEKYARAGQAGALGFVYVNENAEGAIPPTGSVGFTHDGPGGIPAVGVSSEIAARIRRYLADGSVTATLSVDCRDGPATCRNAEAVVGPDDGPEILVTGHVDAHDIADGARDNGAGSVLAAEVGRLLALQDDETGLDTRVRVVAFGGEETGLYGSTHWAEQADLSNVVGQINLDGIGYSRDLQVRGLGLLELFEAAETTALGSIRTSRTASPFNDHWPFVTRGIPSVSCASTAGGEGQVVRYGNLEWGHTHADTLDKLDPRDFRDLAIPLAEATAALAADPDPERIDEPTVREVIPEGLAEYLRFDGRWPF